MKKEMAIIITMAILLLIVSHIIVFRFATERAENITLNAETLQAIKEQAQWDFVNQRYYSHQLWEVATVCD